MKAKNGKQRLTDKMTFNQTGYRDKSCGLYIRVSQDEFVKDASGKKQHRASVDAQKQDAIAYAKSNGWDYIIYDEDCDISGNEDAINRPAIQRIIKDIESGKLHTVYSRDHARFCRNEKLWQIMVWDYFYPYGVEYRDNDGTDIKTNNGLLLAGIKASQNQNFLNENAKKSMRSKAVALSRGQLRTVPPFGYGIKEIDGIRSTYIKEHEGEVVKELFQRIANGEGTQLVMHDFINRGIKTKKNKYMHTSNVIRWIRNPIYKGMTKYNGKQYKAPFPALVSAELWDKANQETDNRASHFGQDRRKAANSHMLTGLLKCGYCFDRLASGGQDEVNHKIFANFIVAKNNTWTKEKGEYVRIRYGIYRCQTKYKHHADSCPESISLKQDYIEGLVRSWVENMIANDYAKRLNGNHAKLDGLTKQLEGITAKIESLKQRQTAINKRYAIGEFDTELEYEQTKRANKDAIAKEESKLNAIREQIDGIAGTGTEQALSDLSKWDKLTTEQKKAGLLKLFDRILIYADRLELFYRATPLASVTLPLKYAQQKGYMVDLDKAKGQLNKAGFTLSTKRS